MGRAMDLSGGYKNFNVRPWADVEAEARQKFGDDEGKIRGVRERYDQAIADMRAGQLTVRERAGSGGAAPAGQEPAAEVPSAAAASPGASRTGGGFLSGVARGGAAAMRAVERPFEEWGAALDPAVKHRAAEALAKMGASKRTAKAVGRGAGSLAGGAVAYAPAMALAPGVAAVLPAATPAALTAAATGALYGSSRRAAQGLTGERPKATDADLGTEAVETGLGFGGAELGAQALGAVAKPVLRPLARLARSSETKGIRLRRSAPGEAPLEAPPAMGTGAGSTPPGETSEAVYQQPAAEHSTAAMNGPGKIGVGAGSTPPSEPATTDATIAPRSGDETAAGMTSRQVDGQASGRTPLGRLAAARTPEQAGRVPLATPAPTGPSGMDPGTRVPIETRAISGDPGEPAFVPTPGVRTAPRGAPARPFRAALDAERQTARAGRTEEMARRAFAAAQGAAEPPEAGPETLVDRLVGPQQAEQAARARQAAYGALQRRAAGVMGSGGAEMPAEAPVLRGPTTAALPPPSVANRPPMAAGLPEPEAGGVSPQVAARAQAAAALRAARGRGFTLGAGAEGPYAEAPGATDIRPGGGTPGAPAAAAAATPPSTPGMPAPAAAGPAVEPLPDSIIAGKTHAELQEDLAGTLDGAKAAKTPGERLFFQRLAQTIRNALARPEVPAEPAAPEVPRAAAGPREAAPASPAGGGAVEAPGGGAPEPEAPAAPEPARPAPPGRSADAGAPPPAAGPPEVPAPEAAPEAVAPAEPLPEVADEASAPVAGEEIPEPTTEVEERAPAPEPPAPPKEKKPRKPKATTAGKGLTRIEPTHPGRTMSAGVRKVIEKLPDPLQTAIRERTEIHPDALLNNLSAKELETLGKGGYYDAATQTLSPKFRDDAREYLNVRDGHIEFVPEPAVPTKPKPRVTAAEVVPGGRGYKAIQRFASDDETRLGMNGVYHDPDGFAVATDGHRLIAVPEKPSWAPDTVVDAGGRKIDASFPAWEHVVPKVGDNTFGAVKDAKKWKKVGELTPAQLKAHTDAVAFGRRTGGRGEGKLVAVRVPLQGDVVAHLQVDYVADIAKAFDDLGVLRIEVYGTKDAGDPVVFREAGAGNRATAVQMPFRGIEDGPHVNLKFDLATGEAPTRAKPATTRKEAIAAALEHLDAELRGAIEAEDWPKVSRLQDEKVLLQQGKPLIGGGVDVGPGERAREFATDLGLTPDERIAVRDLEKDAPSRFRDLTSADFALRKHPVGRKVVKNVVDAYDRAQQLLRTFLGTWHSVVGNPRSAIGERVRGSHYTKATAADEAAFVKAGHASESMGRLLSDTELRGLGLSDQAIRMYRTHNRLMTSWRTKVVNPWRVRNGLGPIGQPGEFYWPHEFYGNWRIERDGQLHVTPAGSSWPTEAEAYAEARQILKDDPGAKVELVPEYAKTLARMGGDKYGDVGALYKAAEVLDRTDRVTADMVRQAVAEGIVPSGFRRRFAMRKGKLGYDTRHIFDTLEGYHRQAAFWVTGEQAHKGYTDLAGRLHPGVDELVARIDPAKEPRTARAVAQFLDQAYGRSRSGEWLDDKVRGLPWVRRFLDPVRPGQALVARGRALTAQLKLGFGNYGVALAHFLHLGTNVMPTLGPKYAGIGIREFLAPSAKSVERLRWAEKHGVFRPRLLEEAAGRAMESASGDLAKDTLRALWQPISVTERWMRQIGFLGSIARLEERGVAGDRLVRLATDDFLRQLPEMERGSEQVLRGMAKRVNELVNFRYDRASRPRAFTGPVGSMMGQFKTYVTGTVQLQKRLLDLGLKDGYGAVALHLGALAALGGVTGGFPFAHLLDDVLYRETGVSPLDHLQRWADRHDGETGGKSQAVVSGLPALLDADITRRVGYSHLHMDRPADLAGPVVNTITDFLTYLHLHDLEHAARLAPGAGNFYDAWKWSTEQMATDPYHRDRLRFTPDDWETALRAFGIQSQTATRTSAELRLQGREDQAFKATKAGLVDRLVRAIGANDHDAINRALADAAAAGVPVDSTTVLDALRKQQTPALQRRLQTVPKALRPEYMERVRPLLDQETRRQAQRALQAAGGGR